MSFQLLSVNRTSKLTFSLPGLICILLAFSCGFVRADDVETTRIGAIIDSNSRIGKEQKVAMQIAVQNFNNTSTRHKLDLHFQFPGPDPLRSAYAGEQSNPYLISCFNCILFSVFIFLFMVFQYQKKTEFWKLWCFHIWLFLFSRKNSFWKFWNNLLLYLKRPISKNCLEDNFWKWYAKQVFCSENRKQFSKTKPNSMCIKLGPSWVWIMKIYQLACLDVLENT